jgi:PTH1 family peptidyl-tRNA hydrolase
LGSRPDGVDLADYVLSAPSVAERELLQNAVQRAADACEAWLTEPIEQVMARFNADAPKR